jgi:hypothetical protein
MLCLSRALPRVCSLLVVMVAVCKCMCLLYDMRKKKRCTQSYVPNSTQQPQVCAWLQSWPQRTLFWSCSKYSKSLRAIVHHHQTVACLLQPCWCRDHTYSTNATAATSRRMLHKMMSAAGVSLACIAVAVITQMVSATIALLGNLHQDQLRTFQH